MCYRVSTIIPRLESSIVYLECSFDPFLLICTILLLRVRLPASPSSAPSPPSPPSAPSAWVTPFILLPWVCSTIIAEIAESTLKFFFHKDKGNLGTSDTLAPPSSSYLKIACHLCLKYNFLRVVTKSWGDFIFPFHSYYFFFAFHSWYEALSLEINFLSCWKAFFWVSLIKW